KGEEPFRVDFRYAPPQWQTAICFPDDPFKSLADKSGALLYHYRQGGREFGTKLWVETAPEAVWQRQELVDAHVPIVRTVRSADGLRIVEEAFACPLPESGRLYPLLRRLDGGGVNLNWADPMNADAFSLRHIALHNNGALRWEAAVPSGGRRRIALALCEGWWDAPGKRVEILRVEGAPPVAVDTVADLGRNKAGAYWFDGRDANGDGKIAVAVEAAPEAQDKNTILNGLWVFAPDQPRDDAALLDGRLDGVAEVKMDPARPQGPPRNDLILVRVRNDGDVPRRLRPKLVVDTRLPFEFDPGKQRVRVNHYETVSCSLRMTGRARTTGPRREIELAPLEVPAGAEAVFFALWSGGGRIVLWPRSLDEALEARRRAEAYWRACPLPYDRVRVPDPGVQALIDSSIRNIWQAREIKDGLPAFQVGPTCYRGLWIVDGAFLLETAAMLGAGDQARNGVAYELRFQKPDGRIEVMKNYHKENGIVLWTCVRHARLTRDKAWLESIWPQLERVAAYIKRLRRMTYKNDSPLDDGLNPPGFPDGGIGGVIYEYTNPYWNLAGLRAFIEGAKWLGKSGEAAAWQKEFDDFMAAFRKAAARDMRTDFHGNRYLPIRMDGKDLPQRGQWAFCHAVYPGRIFPRNDPLVLGNMAMLEATEREGMVYGTGWDPTGIWNYFASFYGHAWLWLGRGRKAAQALYAFANHAAPTLVWREEQSLKGGKFRKVGDMPHNWASAEFIRLAIHLLELDRGRELHLFEGLPAEWTRPGMRVELRGVATPFGPLTLCLATASDGKSAELRLGSLADASCRKVVVHLGGWARADRAATLELDPRRDHRLTIPIRRGGK
ncbi:MAG: hypothetical protein J7M29_11965, partial [Verrucomicrobia bacterium]|nr:hypothetical protein [Verrucomicrobiota bacterium]